MNAITAFVLGLLVGWVVEWIIDWVYWRGRRSQPVGRLEPDAAVLAQQADLRRAAGARADLESQLTALKAELSDSQQKLAGLEAERSACQDKLAALEAEKASWQAPTVGAAIPGAAAPSVAVPSVTVPPVAVPVPVPPVPAPPLPSIGTDVPSAPAERAAQMEPEKQEEQKKPETPDDLVIINGIGPVINRKLNEAGIYTFRQLANLTAAQLRAIVGDVIQRLADEDDIINQAKTLADQKDQAANR